VIVSSIYFWSLLLTVSLITAWIVLTDKRIDSYEHHLVYSGKADVFTLASSILATCIGGGTSIGLVAFGYESGTAGMVVFGATMIGFMVVGLLAKRIIAFRKRLKILTLPQFLGDYYCGVGQNRFHFRELVAGVNLVLFFCVLAVQFVGMATLLNRFFNVSYLPALLFTSVLTITYTTYGGVSGVYRTDKLQMVFITVFVVLLLGKALPEFNSTMETIKNTDIAMLKGTKLGMTFIIGAVLFGWLIALARIDNWQRILSAQNAKTASRAFYLSALLLPVYLVVFVYVGLVVWSKNPDLNPNDATFYYLKNYFSKASLYLCLVGLMSTIISSVDSFLNITSITLVNDILPYTSVFKTLQINRIRLLRKTTVLCGVLAVIFSLVFSNIVQLVVVSLTGVVIFTPSILAALFGKKVNFAAAYSSTVVGTVVFLLVFCLSTLGVIRLSAEAAFVPAFFSSLLVFVAVRFRYGW